ncbi:amidohydrolase family protein [Novosphingobium sp. G106]|uniref:amidohydrolase family protein n=1 Tax=Novosphingobium sp. G106 TaxID=2849500 RepID=UPI001C2CE4C2|nr:amidohydrolase family protein [Novosphingobium sp. G106]MBV1690578.1 amidohydrolase family protein [Novosphingobium sp. G106]
MDAPIDINFRAVRVSDEYELVDSPTIATRIAARLNDAEQEPRALRLLTPPVYYSLAGGIEDNRAVNDALVAAAREIGSRAFGVAEPKYADAAAREIERLASLGAVGVVWSPRAQGLFGNDAGLAELIRHAHGLGLLSMVHSAPYSIDEGLWRLWNLAGQCGGAPLVILGAFESWESIQQVRDAKGGPPGVFYDLSAMSEGYDLDHLVASMGADRLLFGTGGGDGFAETMGVIERSTIGEQDRNAILHRNAAGLFPFVETPA